MDRRYYHSSKDQNQKESNSSIALTAVALQDHLSRTLSLGVNRGPRTIGLGPAARAREKKYVAKSVIDTGRNRPKPKKIPKAEDAEYVLDTQPPPLTLAQKFGLIDAPEQLLSESEWKNIKDRSNKREDSRQPCVICKEDFGLQPQVLLSCTHVFHKACLQAFERYTGRKTCPMCRREQYQTRLIHEGAKQHKITCIIRIQAAWRGYIVRSWYRKLRETHPPADPRLRKKFFEEKLQTITDRMVRSCDFNVGDFLSEMDQSLKESRNVFRNFDAMFKQMTDEEWDTVQLKAVERGHCDCPICLTSLTNQGPASTQSNPEQNPVSKTTKKTKPNPLLKLQNYSLSKSRPGNVLESKSITEPIPPPVLSIVPTPCDENEKEAASRTTVLLSCSHVFHETCLDMLEQLAMGELKKVCPVCRTLYQKKVIQLGKE